MSSDTSCCLAGGRTDFFIVIARNLSNQSSNGWVICIHPISRTHLSSFLLTNWRKDLFNILKKNMDVPALSTDSCCTLSVKVRHLQCIQLCERLTQAGRTEQAQRFSYYAMQMWNIYTVTWHFPALSDSSATKSVSVLLLLRCGCWSSPALCLCPLDTSCPSSCTVREQRTIRRN